MFSQADQLTLAQLNAAEGEARTELQRGALDMQGYQNYLMRISAMRQPLLMRQQQTQQMKKMQAFHDIAGEEAFRRQMEQADKEYAAQNLEKRISVVQDPRTGQEHHVFLDAKGDPTAPPWQDAKYDKESTPPAPKEEKPVGALDFFPFGAQLAAGADPEGKDQAPITQTGMARHIEYTRRAVESQAKEADKRARYSAAQAILADRGLTGKVPIERIADDPRIRTNPVYQQMMPKEFLPANLENTVKGMVQKDMNYVNEQRQKVPVDPVQQAKMRQQEQAAKLKQAATEKKAAEAAKKQRAKEFDDAVKMFPIKELDPASGKEHVVGYDLEKARKHLEEKDRHVNPDDWELAAPEPGRELLGPQWKRKVKPTPPEPAAASDAYVAQQERNFIESQLPEGWTMKDYDEAVGALNGVGQALNGWRNARRVPQEIAAPTTAGGAPALNEMDKASMNSAFEPAQPAPAVGGPAAPAPQLSAVTGLDDAAAMALIRRRKAQASTNLGDYVGPNALTGDQKPNVDTDTDAARQWLKDHGYGGEE